TSPVPASTRRFRIHDRTTSGGNEAVGQHDATAGPVMSADVGVVIVGASVAFSTPSMIVVLSSSDPCQDREGVEQPIGKARQLAGQDGDTHSGDNRTSAEL